MDDIVVIGRESESQRLARQAAQGTCAMPGVTDAARQVWADQHYHGKVEELRRAGKTEVLVLMPGRTKPFKAGGELLAQCLARGGRIVD